MKPMQAKLAGIPRKVVASIKTSLSTGLLISNADINSMCGIILLGSLVIG
jgi:hypothetical protein